MCYLFAWKGRQKAHANIHQTNRYLMNICRAQSTLLGREILKERENKQMQQLIRHSTCPRWLAKLVGITDNKAKHVNCRSEAEINAAWDAQETTTGLGNNKLTLNMWWGKWILTSWWKCLNIYVCLQSDDYLRQLRPRKIFKSIYIHTQQPMPSYRHLNYCATEDKCV